MRKQIKSHREFMLHKIFHTQAHSGVSYKIVSYREKTIIDGQYLCPSERPVGKESYLPSGPHHHFHPFHLGGQADPNTHGREKETISRVPGKMSYKSI